MNTALTETRRKAPVRRAVPVSPGSAAVLVATAVAADGGAAALQAWEGETLVARLAAQFTSLGIEHIHVVTRVGWAEAIAAAVESARRYDPAVVGKDWASLLDELAPRVP